MRLLGATGMLTLKQVGAIRVWDLRSILAPERDYKKNSILAGENWGSIADH